MARLASQIKGGYYPMAPEAVEAVLHRLRPPTHGECVILDPCAGNGLALLQFAQGLGDATPYGIELSEDRSRVLSALLDEHNTLAPADFFRCMVSHGTMSFALVNPPYDYAAGGDGRMEMQFLHKAVGLLADGGVLALVCPQDVAESYQTRELFEPYCCDISALPFPDEVRRFNETVILGRKRKSPVMIGSLRSWEWLDQKLEQNIVYTLPPGARPKVFRKTEPTDAELVRLVAESPLRFLMAGSTERGELCARPPMSPGIEHRAMLLASGQIDGLITPPDEPPHVIRGTADKEQYLASCDTAEDDDGNMTTRTILSEKARLVMRVLDHLGTITTLT